MELKKTPLYQRHLQSNGRIIDFGGWALPVEYGSVLSEAKAVRTSAGIFDASHMGEIVVKGEGALDFLQKLSCNDLSRIKEGKLQYNLILNRRAGVIDDVMIYQRKKSFLCVVNADNKDKVYIHFKENKSSNLDLADESESTALICVQGPASVKVIEKVFGESIAALQYLHFFEGKIDKKEVLISRSGYTGEDGFELYVPSKDALYWWDKLIEAGRNFGLKNCGLGARDILRIEAGYPLYGHELNEEINPYEASLGWVVKLNKDFIGKERLKEIKNVGVKRKRVGFIMQERAMARQNYLVSSEGKAIGKVSSATYSSNLSKFIGMLYVEKEYAKIDTLIEIKVRDKFYPAKIVNFPFVEIRTKRVK